MLVALRHPELVERLCVVDVSPVAYHHTRGVPAATSTAMQGLDLARARPARRRRRGADRGGAQPDRAQLPPAEPPPRGRRLVAGRLNLDVLGRDLAELGGWPADRLDRRAPYDGPVLWIAGETSDYVTDEYAEAMDRLFPRNRTGDDQGRRPLGPLRAARGVHRGAAPVRWPERSLSLAAPGRPRRRRGCRRTSSSSGGSGCARGRATTPSQPSSAHTPSRDVSSARITSIIAIAVSIDDPLGQRRRRSRRRGGASRARRDATSSGRSVTSARMLVDQRDGVVAVGGEQLAQPWPERAHGVELSRGSGRAGRCSSSESRTSSSAAIDGQGVGLERGVGERHGGLERHLAVISERPR